MSLFTSIKNFFSRIKNTPSIYELREDINGIFYNGLERSIWVEERTYNDVVRPLTAEESNSHIVRGNASTTPRPQVSDVAVSSPVNPQPNPKPKRKYTKRMKVTPIVITRTNIDDENNGAAFSHIPMESESFTPGERIYPQDNNVRDTSHDDGQFGGGGASSSWVSSNDSSSSSSSDSGSSSYDSGSSSSSSDSGSSSSSD